MPRFGNEVYPFANQDEASEAGLAHAVALLRAAAAAASAASDAGRHDKAVAQGGRVCILVGRGTVPERTAVTAVAGRETVWIPCDCFGGAFRGLEALPMQQQKQHQPQLQQKHQHPMSSQDGYTDPRVLFEFVGTDDDDVAVHAQSPPPSSPSPPPLPPPPPHLWMDFNDPGELARLSAGGAAAIIVDWSTWRYMRPTFRPAVPGGGGRSPAVADAWRRLLAADGGTLFFESGVASVRCVAGGDAGSGGGGGGGDEELEVVGFEDDNPVHVVVRLADARRVVAARLGAAVAANSLDGRRVVVPAPRLAPAGSEGLKEGAAADGRRARVTGALGVAAARGAETRAAAYAAVAAAARASCEAMVVRVFRDELDWRCVRVVQAQAEVGENDDGRDAWDSLEGKEYEKEDGAGSAAWPQRYPVETRGLVEHIFKKEIAAYSSSSTNSHAKQSQQQHFSQADAVQRNRAVVKAKLKGQMALTKLGDEEAFSGEEAAFFFQSRRGIVGTKNGRYMLVGEVVDECVRLCHESQAGTVNVSPKTHKVIGDAIY
ncbi:hypothetical protein HK405_009995 [Cladochytrium tenue]|nr:hypothetical protein HK405_009995 [Cladochytrium tenue]